MISSKEANKLLRLAEGNIEGLIKRNELINWLIKVQENGYLSSEMTTKEATEILKSLNVRVAKTHGEWLRFKDRYTSKCELPNMVVRTKGSTAPLKQAKPISKEQLEELYINKGISKKEICFTLHISFTRLDDLLKQYNLTRSKQEKEAPISKQELEDLYLNKKYSIYNINKITGVSLAYIAKYMKIYEIKPRSTWTQSNKKDVQKTELEKLRSNGVKVEEILKMLNISRKTYYKKMNLEVV